MEIPGYTILRKIGRGGMATVYLAVQESLDRQVALKVMQPASVRDETFTERFLKEGRIIAQFQHPQIITVYDFGSCGSDYYFSMEFLPEGTLAQQIEQGLSLERALDIIRSMAGALAYAHGRGVIHRDIKPQNILFRQDGTPVLSDFGIAKVVDADDTQLTAPGLAIGSPVYMSPEQITGRKLDNRSDLYSLGIVFYEMLARQPPYRADDVISIAMMHCSQPVPQLPAGFGHLQPVLQKLLAKDPADRFESAEEFVRALDHPRTRLSLYSVRDTTRIFQAFKNSSSPKKILLAGGLSLSILAVGSTIYSTLFRRLTQTDPEIGVIGLPPIPENRSAIAANYEQLAVKHFQKNEFEQSLELIKLGLNVSPSDARLSALRERVERYREAARLLEQAQRYYRDGGLDRSLQLVEEGLQRVPDHGGLGTLRDALQAQFQQRRQRAGQLLTEAHARWQGGDAEGGLELIEEGLRLVPGHPELSTLREVIRGRLEQRQRIAQLLIQARELQQRGELDESLKRIEEGLSLVADQPELLALRDRVKAAMQASSRVAELLRDCATRFPLDRLSSRKGGEVVACYNRITVLAPDNGEARAKLEQLADRYADWAKAAIDQADFQLAEEYLAQLGQLESGHPQLASLNQALRAKREQVSSEAQQKIENEARQQAAEDATASKPPKTPSAGQPKKLSARRPKRPSVGQPKRLSARRPKTPSVGQPKRLSVGSRRG